MPDTEWHFVVARDDLRRSDILSGSLPASRKLGPNEALLGVEKFAVTANNITYAALGESLRYWNFFPAPPPWGRVPVWGYARVVESNHPDVAVGRRVFGFLPMSTHLVVTPHVTATGLADTVAHRAELAGTYNRYAWADAIAPDGKTENLAEDLAALIRPLYVTSFLLDQFLQDNAFFGASAVVLSSASSKTAIGLAHLLKQRGGIEVVGLTSRQNEKFARALGYYSQIVDYDSIRTGLPRSRSVFVDFSGNAGVIAEVHERLSDRLAYSCRVGFTHWEAPTDDSALPGPTPIWFFAPDHIKAKSKQWGPGGLEEKSGAAFRDFTLDAVRWLSVSHAAGPEGTRAAYHAALEGTATPDAGKIVTIAS